MKVFGVNIAANGDGSTAAATGSQPNSQDANAESAVFPQLQGAVDDFKTSVAQRFMSAFNELGKFESVAQEMDPVVHEWLKLVNCNTTSISDLNAAKTNVSKAGPTSGCVFFTNQNSNGTRSG